MKKFTKENYLHLLVFAILLAVYVLIATKGFNFLYGSSVDWDCQHYVIPDYFRQLFYKTGNLLPSFAFNLGNGQNIFNFSYYGLLNPIILISYLLPFIDMAVYVQISSIAVTFISIVFYLHFCLCLQYQFYFIVIDILCLLIICHSLLWGLWE